MEAIPLLEMKHEPRGTIGQQQEPLKDLDIGQRSRETTDIQEGTPDRVEPASDPNETVGLQERPSPATQSLGGLNRRETSSSALIGRQNDAFALIPISRRCAEDMELPALKFMPLILWTGPIFCTLVFNLIVLGLLLILLFYGSFTSAHQWGYLTIQILPPVLGTITSTLVRGITVDLCRLVPFMLAAAPTGSTFHKTILASYFPGLSLGSAIEAGNGPLVTAWILEGLVGFILSFKSTLLNTTQYEDYVEAIVTPWALYFVIAIYIVTCVLLIVLACALHDRVTGLRWDPVSIADHLTLFRQSNFLDKFAGTDTATRDTITKRLRDDRLKLGYWIHGDEVWHGFGVEPTQTEALSGSSAALQRESLRQIEQQRIRPVPRSPPTEIKGFSLADISLTRYRSVALNMEHWMAYIWIAITLVLLAAFVAGLAFGFVNGKTFSISYNLAIVAFQFVPTFLLSLYTWFWQDVDVFARSTQPFRGMSRPNPASENLLLDYNTLPPLVVTYVAWKKKHWRIALTSLMAVTQRLLPILVAGSTTVVPEDEDYSTSTIYASRWLFIYIIVWLASYCVLIPLEVFGWKFWKHRGHRHLPRSYSSISDLLTWSYASKILRSNDGDPFEVNLLDKNRKKAEQWYITACLMQKPNDDGQDFAKYSFGLYESIEHEGVKCIGFDVATNVTTVTIRKENRRDVEATEETIRMLAPADLEHVLSEGKERWTDPKTLNQQTVPPQGEEGVGN